MSFYLHFFLLFCVIGFTPMRFPRVKAEGQSFYTASPEWLTVDSFSRLSATVPPRRKDLCYLCDGWRPFATYGS